MKACECEHICHFEEPRITPHGKTAHKYAQEFDELVSVQTPHGVYRTCKACADDCYSYYSQLIQEHP